MIRLRKYEQELASVQVMLKGFSGKGIINVMQLHLMDKIIKWSEEDQFRILNDASLSLDEQRAIFGGIRNINVAMRSMKERLEQASEKRENPTTAELALELMPSFSTLFPEIDAFFNEKKTMDVEYFSKFSRILYRKAKSLGFSKDVASQLSEAKITRSQVKAFLENLKKNIAVELDIEEEVSSSDDSNNRNVNAS